MTNVILTMLGIALMATGASVWMVVAMSFFGIIPRLEIREREEKP